MTTDTQKPAGGRQCNGGKAGGGGGQGAHNGLGIECKKNGRGALHCQGAYSRRHVVAHGICVGATLFK
jgi:hypothetical protein